MPVRKDRVRRLSSVPALRHVGRVPVTELLEAAAGAPPVTRVLPDVAVALAEATSMRRATLLLYDRRGNLVAGTSRQIDGTLDARLWAAFQLLHDSMPAVDSARRGAAPIVFAQPETALGLGPGDWVERFEARTVVVAPLRSRQRTLGVVVLDDPERGAIDDAQLAALDEAATGAANVLELLDAVEHERKARARTEQVVQTSAAAARSMSASAALTAVTEGLQRLTGGQLVVAWTTQGPEERIEWTGDAAHARTVARAVQAQWTDGGKAAPVQLDLTESIWEPIAALGYRRALAVPLQHLSRSLGWVVTLSSSAVSHTSDEIRSAEIVGEQASLALHTTSLLEAERAAVDRLTELDRLKNTFVAAVSHELRTPLTAILGFSELLAEEVVDPGLSRHLDDLRREAAVLEALIGNLLDTSRLEAGLLRLNIHPVDLSTTIEQAIEVVRHAHPDRVLRSHTPGSLAPIQADGVRLRQVFINLIENAAKYSPENTVVDITVAGERIEAGVRWIDITVDDEGPGIAPEERQRVFERFRRLATHEESPGTGIGLYVVRALIEAHGGSVVVEDGPQGWGTRFRITLPAAALPS